MVEYLYTYYQSIIYIDRGYRNSAAFPPLFRLGLDQAHGRRKVHGDAQRGQGMKPQAVLWSGAKASEKERKGGGLRKKCWV